MVDWNSFWTVLGICGTFAGAIILDKMFPNMVTKHIQKQPIDSYYVPDYIDRVGDIVMKRK